MNTYYIIEKGQKLVNVAGTVWAVTIGYTVWGTPVMDEKTYPFSRETKKEATLVAKECGMVVETKVLTEEQFDTIREN